MNATSTLATNTSAHSGVSRTWMMMFRETFANWSADNALRLSAALAYYSVFSIAPLLVITIAIAGLALDDEAATGRLFEGMKGYVGAKAAVGVEEMVKSAAKPKTGVIAAIIGTATLLLGASGVFGQLKDALNTIWEVELKKGTGVMFFLRSKFLNFGMVLAIGLLLLISLVLSSWLAAFNQSMEHILALPALVWTILTSVVSVGMATVLFAMLFKFLPDVKIRWREVWVGAALTAVLFELGKAGLAWYLGRESTADAYGSAGSVVLLLLWVYYASCILLLGAEFTQVYAEKTGSALEPKATAVRINRADSDRPVTSDAEDLPPHAATPVGSWGEHSKFPPSDSHWQRFLAPLIKYMEARGLLLSLEAKEALGQAITLLIVGAIAVITVLVGWALLAVALVGVLTSYLDWIWVKAVAVTGGGHLLVALGSGLFVWWRATRGTWFTDTINELKKDRLWLKGIPR